jgi:alpha-beta hydrolase superfamily lysophospholipase
MPTFTGVRGAVHYREWLVDEPRANYVFLHGFGEHSGLYDRLAEALGSAGLNVFALDQIGHGLSEGERGLVESLDDLVANGRILTDIASVRPPDLPLILAGHSLGGVTAALTLARYPRDYDAVVLSGTPLSALPWVEELAASGATELALDPAELSADPWYLDALEHDPLSFTSAHVARTLGGTLPPAWDELALTLPGVTAPILLVHGESDPLVPIDDVRVWADRLPAARLAAFPDARHDVLNETVHHEVATTITGFVESVLHDPAHALRA